MPGCIGRGSGIRRGVQSYMDTSIEASHLYINHILVDMDGYELPLIY